MMLVTSKITGSLLLEMVRDVFQENLTTVEMEERQKMLDYPILKVFLIDIQKFSSILYTYLFIENFLLEFFKTQRFRFQVSLLVLMAKSLLRMGPTYVKLMKMAS